MTKVSDHLPCFSIMKLNTKTVIKPKLVKVTKITPNNINKFKEEVCKRISQTEFDRNPLIDPNQNYNKLEKIITNAKVKCFPETTTKFNKYKHKICPWMTYGILNSTRSRDRMYVKLKQVDQLDPGWHRVQFLEFYIISPFLEFYIILAL